MDLSYPPEVSALQARVADAVRSLEAQPPAERPLGLWGGDLAVGSDSSAADHVADRPLARFVALRTLGGSTGPLPRALRAAGVGWLPSLNSLPRLPLATALGVTPGPAADHAAPAARLEGCRATGEVAVAPFCLPAQRVLLLAQRSDAADDVALVAGAAGSGTPRRQGERYVLALDAVEMEVLVEGEAAHAAWQEILASERLGLVGLAIGVVDRARDLALGALRDADRRGEPLSQEQETQFLVADNDLDRFAAEALALDAAVAAEEGRLNAASLALVRYATAAAAVRCAQRALHLAGLFCPDAVAAARALRDRADHLSLFDTPLEHEVRVAAAGLTTSATLD